MKFDPYKWDLFELIEGIYPRETVSWAGNNSDIASLVKNVRCKEKKLLACDAYDVSFSGLLQTTNRLLSVDVQRTL